MALIINFRRISGWDTFNDLNKHTKKCKVKKRKPFTLISLTKFRIGIVSSDNISIFQVDVIPASFFF